MRKFIGSVVMPRKLERWLRRVNYRLGNWYYEVRNRFFARYYLLDIKAMKRGQCYDTDYQMFHAVFQLLVNFVENEKAHLAKICFTKEYLANYPGTHSDIVAWHNASWWDRWRNRQQWNERLGIAHLEVEAAMDDPDSPHYHEHCERQAEDARKTLALYKWYKYERPVRPDVWDVVPMPEYHFVHEVTGAPLGSGWQNAFETPTEPNPAFYTMRKMTEEYKEYLDKGHALTEAYEKEDTRKAQEVLAIRRSLWT